MVVIIIRDINQATPLLGVQYSGRHDNKGENYTDYLSIMFYIPHTSKF